MSGVAVYQDSPESLKALQHGFDGTSAKVIKLDTSGRQLIATEAGQAIEVTSTELDIRNISNTQDNIVVYGNDGTTNRVVKTDASGRTVITNDAGETVEVSATDLDIRSLSDTQDSIAVYGNDGTTSRVLKTDSEGVLQVLASKVFTNASQSVTTADSYAGSAARDISLQSVYTFFVNNTGANSATVKVEISPDNTLWLDDSAEFTLAATEVKAYSVNKFANYARVSYKSTASGSSTDLTIIFQAQA